jgi:hypothetical protein
MPTAQARRKRIGALRGARRWACGACLALVAATAGHATASELFFGGQVSLSHRTTESDMGGDSQQQAVSGTLNGVGYLWRPWFATVGLRLQLSLVDTEADQPGLTATRSTDEQVVSGETRLNLFPRSHFPFTALADVYDARVETDQVGVPLQDIDTLRRERVGFNQQYRAPGGDASYAVDYLHSRQVDRDASRERTDDVRINASHQFDRQSLQYGLSVRGAERQELGLRRTSGLDTLNLRHSYRPAVGFTIENVVDLIRDDEQLEGVDTRDDLYSAFDTSMTWRAARSNWSVRTRLGMQKLESDIGATGLVHETLSASGIVSYDFSRALRFSGDVGVNRTRAEASPQSYHHFQNLTLAYAPAPVPVGAAQYHWGAAGTLGNTDDSDQPSVQNLSLNVRHGLDRILADGRGRTITLSASQSASQFLDSENGRLFTLNHGGSAAVAWNGGDTSSRLQANLGDSRLMGQGPDSRQNEAIDQTSQTADVLGTHSIRTSRFSALEGDANVGVTRVLDQDEESRFVFATVGAGYSHQHAFAVDRLRIRSRLEYAAYDSRQGAFATESEERLSWDNRLDYTVGLLNMNARRTVTELDGSRTTTTSVGASRSF